MDAPCTDKRTRITTSTTLPGLVYGMSMIILCRTWEVSSTGMIHFVLETLWRTGASTGGVMGKSMTGKLTQHSSLHVARTHHLQSQQQQQFGQPPPPTHQTQMPSHAHGALLAIVARFG